MAIPTLLLAISVLLAPVTCKYCTDPDISTTEEPLYTTELATLPPPPENWPKGRFTLLRAAKDCPESVKGGKFRSGGEYYQDTEDYRNANSWPKEAGYLSEGLKHDGYVLRFCQKHFASGDEDFPAGSYCVYNDGHKKTCPAGFTKGSVTWDDENDNNANRKPSKAAFLKRIPAGTYNEDTTMEFCCRSDGSPSRPILLPAATPFYLFANPDSSCQAVGHMDLTEEEMVWDNEDSDNHSAVDGSTPVKMTSQGDMSMTLCHYTPMA